MATLCEFTYYSSHKDDLDFQHSTKAIKLGYNYFISIRNDKSLTVKLW